jgi:mortality factor 4-like protein 1
MAPQVQKIEQRTTESGNKEPQYFLHYQGWNKKWDEWVEQARVMIYNEENLLLQKQHNSKKRAAANSKKNEVRSPVSASQLACELMPKLIPAG